MLRSILTLLLTFALFTTASAQSWSGIIASTRAIDWTTAGATIDPGGTRTQCGSTINGYTGTAATINNAIAACTANHYVQLAAGTFN
jgi:hypothetical protein